ITAPKAATTALVTAVCSANTTTTEPPTTPPSRCTWPATAHSPSPTPTAPAKPPSPHPDNPDSPTRHDATNSGSTRAQYRHAVAFAFVDGDRPSAHCEQSRERRSPYFGSFAL